MFIEEMKHFIAVAQKKSPICTLDDGKQALRLALAAHEFERRGTLVKLS